jgi:hypothetical protein
VRTPRNASFTASSKRRHDGVVDAVELGELRSEDARCLDALLARRLDLDVQRQSTGTG